MSLHTCTYMVYVQAVTYGMINTVQLKPLPHSRSHRRSWGEEKEALLTRVEECQSHQQTLEEQLSETKRTNKKVGLPLKFLLP